ncbi:MAG: ribosomal-processing cysteine protease Prp [Quinella sp. 1Q7]|nr:ribosomal-processing cysteine protease Prp [Quinella sp. 1Q7]
MIVAEIYVQGDGKIAAFVIRGHSGGGKNSHGYNVRCAEVSMLSQSAYLGIRQYLQREVSVANHEYGGLGLELKAAPDDLTEAVFQTMLIGLREVKQVAPKAIKIRLIRLDKSAEDNLQSAVTAMNPKPRKPLPNVDIESVKIRADIYRRGEKIIGFSLTEFDSDVIDELNIYCAGTWILVKSAFACLKNFLKRDVVSLTGGTRFAMRLKNSPDDVTEAVFQTMLIGLLELEKQAPHIISVRENSLGGET